MFREFDFAPNPERLAESAVSRMKLRFTNSELKKIDIARILTGFYSVRVATGKKFDALFFSYMREAAIASGRFSEAEFYELLTTLPKDGYGKFIPLKDIGRRVEDLKRKGLNVGLKFGHYRRLTMNHIFELVYVRHACDHLILIIESGERTSRFKGKRIELEDDQRIEMFKRSCLVNSLGMTEGLDYSDGYYRNLVKSVKPTTLFISGSWPDEVQEEYVKRARLSGAEPFVVPNIPALTTSSMEHLIFPKI